MDIGQLVGKQIKNIKTDEVGVVVSGRDVYIEVKFSSKEIKYKIPMAFGQGYIAIVDDPVLQKQLIGEYETETAEKMRNVSAAKRKKENPNEVDHRDFVQLGISFSSHIEAIEECFGVRMKAYRPAYKAFTDKGIAIWFPSIAKQVMGEYIPADTSEGWLDVLAEGGTMIYEKNVVDDEKNNAKRDTLDRLVFAKFDEKEGYHFLGVFRPLGYDEEKGFCHKRIGTKYDLNEMKVIS